MRNTIHRKMMTLVFCWEMKWHIICSWLILLLGSMLEYLGKLIVVKHPILDRSLSVHLINLSEKQNDYMNSREMKLWQKTSVCLRYFPIEMSVQQYRTHRPQPNTQQLERIISRSLPTSSSVNLSPIVVRSSRSLSSWISPTLSSSKHPKAFLMTSSGSVPWEII